ncbi:MAG: hypothetical protein V7739_05145 [Motiliproteus sp.]
MSAHDMGSWIIILTFFITSAYLMFEGKSFKPINLASSLGTALIMCFGGLLFTGVVKYVVTEIGSELNNEVILGALVPIGVLICLAIRHFWYRRVY